MQAGVSFNDDSKFDIQLSAALIRERELSDIFTHGAFMSGEAVRLELKTETWQWRRTGNLAIEYQQRGKPSGIAVTEADYWVHGLCADDGTPLGWFIVPIAQLKAICRAAHRRGAFREGVGDGGNMSIVLLSVADLIGYLFGGVQ